MLGDFEKATFRDGRTTWRLERAEANYRIRSQGAEAGEYEVAWANTYRVGVQYTPSATRCGNAVYNRHRAPMSRLVRALAMVPNVRAAAFRQSATEIGVEGLAAVATSTTSATTLAGLSFIDPALIVLNHAA